MNIVALFCLMLYIFSYEKNRDIFGGGGMRRVRGAGVCV